MKTIIIFLFIIFLCFCKTPQYIYEDTLYVTRKYIGDFDTSFVEGKYTKVVTTKDYFYIAGRVELIIPDKAKCYLKYESQNIKFDKYWILYFTYEGTEDYYMLRQNYIIGKIY